MPKSGVWFRRYYAAGPGANAGSRKSRPVGQKEPVPPVDNGESERAIRPLAIGRRNWLFAGSKNGGDATGILLSLVQSCRAVDVEPFAYLDDVLRRINGHPASRVAELLPHNWKKAESYYA